MNVSPSESAQSDIVVTNPSACRNCDSELIGHYCSSCGQPDKHVNPSLHDLLHELTHEILHLDGKIVSTLKVLLCHPGRLSKDHFEGKRARYVGPIRLYLTLSLIFFIVAAHIPASHGNVKLKNLNVDAGKRGFSAQIIADDGKSETNSQNKQKEKETSDELQKDSPISAEAGHPAAEQDEDGLGEKITAAVTKAVRAPELFKEAFLHNTSRIMFLLVPLFALGLRVVYRNRNFHYPAYVYFSLHVHSFVFLVLSISLLTEYLKINFLSHLMSTTVMLWCAVYLFLALRRVFAGTVTGTVAKIAFLAICYLPCFGIALAIAAVATVYSM